MQRAVFLDRDGTISEEAGYINHIDRFNLYSYSPEAVRSLNNAGFKVILITNQSGVARGYFPETLVHQVHAKLQQGLAKSGAHLDAIFYCPHHPQGKIAPFNIQCDCRKPRTGMLLKAADQFALDLNASFVVGDKYVDVDVAHRAGARGIMVMTGYGRGEHLYLSDTWPRQPDHLAENLATAVNWILDASKGNS